MATLRNKSWTRKEGGGGGVPGRGNGVCEAADRSEQCRDQCGRRGVPVTERGRPAGGDDKAARPWRAPKAHLNILKCTKSESPWRILLEGRSRERWKTDTWVWGGQGYYWEKLEARPVKKTSRLAGGCRLEYREHCISTVTLTGFDLQSCQTSCGMLGKFLKPSSNPHWSTC